MEEDVTMLGILCLDASWHCRCRPHVVTRGHQVKWDDVAAVVVDEVTNTPGKGHCDETFAYSERCCDNNIEMLLGLKHFRMY